MHILLCKNLANKILKLMSYQTQGFDNEVLDLIKQKGFDSYKYMCDFEKFKEKFSSKSEFYSLLNGKGISDKEHQHVFKVWNKFEMKTMKDYHDL